MQQEKEEFYNIIKSTGELFVLFEDMTGDWEKDKEAFCKNYDSALDEMNDVIDDFNDL